MLGITLNILIRSVSLLMDILSYIKSFFIHCDIITEREIFFSGMVKTEYKYFEVKFDG